MPNMIICIHSGDLIMLLFSGYEFSQIVHKYAYITIKVCIKSLVMVIVRNNIQLLYKYGTELSQMDNIVLHSAFKRIIYLIEIYTR